MTNIPNTFGLDVKAKILAEYHSIDELCALLEQYKGERILHIGAGSNLLFTRDFDGVILHSAMRRARATKEDAEHVWIEAENGLVLDDLIAQLCDMGLSGMENLSYIPGEVGASAVQNVGAYGVEAKDVITEVRAIDMSDGSERTFTNAECRYGYRDSIFKNELKDRYIITSVVYHVEKGDARAKREEIIATRQAKLPKVGETGSAGSFFKNPFVPEQQANELLAQYPDMPHFPAPSLEGRAGERFLCA